MLETLFSSRVRAKIITVLFMSPGTGYYALELAQRLDESYGGVWKELARLEKNGLLTSEHRGNSKVYMINPDCPIAPELRQIVLKTEGVGKAIREKISGLGEVKAAFIFGSYASGEADAHSDLDLMVIGEVELGQFSALISQLEHDLGRPINYVIYSEDDWKDRLEGGDAFVVNVQQSAKVMIIGGEDGL
jgi:predicted nucleotidyltransferase